LYLSFLVRHFHLFSRKASKIKNFSLIPTSWYYLPKIPITADWYLTWFVLCGNIPNKEVHRI
ncbi:MAG: hypothetical protein RXQ80_05470, partial [Sulfolobaceae archaeon]